MLVGARVSPVQLRQDIRAVKARTDYPFGANFQLLGPEEGNRNVDAEQHFLDRFREELGLPPGATELTQILSYSLPGKGSELRIWSRVRTR